MKNKGFTLIELLIVIAIIGIVGSIGASFFMNQGSFSYGINGFTETRCEGGYKFVVGARGHLQQVLNEKGGGVPCN